MPNPLLSFFLSFFRSLPPPLPPAPSPSRSPTLLLHTAPLRRPPGKNGPPAQSRRNHRAFSVSRCLSRACLGKPVVSGAFPDVCPEPVLVNLSCFSIPKMPRKEALLSFRTRVERGRLQRRQLPAHQLQEKRRLFECFPYVCPEPVWAKRSLLHSIIGAKTAFSHLRRASKYRQRPRRCGCRSAPRRSRCCRVRLVSVRGLVQ